ncbi:nicotinamide-nucleotide amidohydrolase family protein [Nocardioides sp. J2M5]|uniref:CinA family protein n=1 Tax=Nocardioides palaemonis TaxID=2829810 RepID=UPI001BAE34DE|nr:nicotinamide-nucleotide amidohydrolase family protein [Nocardioides palaemonis]MBS2938298.1 nicotinamide-nucleotide amidohydrolase family protein [Nocardioides palaemonis]
MWLPQAHLALDLLVGSGGTVACAESLTGGLLAARLTDVPGASRALVGGVVSYATRVKVSLLDVPEDVVARHGVVSGECAAAMAQGVRRRLDATWGVSTTGVAGPDPQEGHPAGTVWVGVAGPDGLRTRLLALEGDRSGIREATCAAALDLLVETMRGSSPGKKPSSGSVGPTTPLDRE